jgi:hypothetical protein
MIQHAATILLLLIAPLLVQSQSKEAPVCLATDRDSDCYDSAAFTCGLWLASSTAVPGTLSVYTGKMRSASEQVADPGVLLVPVVDPNKNQWSPLQSIARASTVGLPLEGQFLNDIYIAGLGPLLHCSDEYVNLNPHRNETEDSVGVHRFTDPTAGSFSYHHNFAFRSTRKLYEGEELMYACSGNLKPAENEVKRMGQPVQWLKENGVCIDTLSVGPSTLPGVGRGAFSEPAVEKDQVIAISPVVQVDRFEMQMVDQFRAPGDKIAAQRKHAIKYTSKVVGQQLLLNYCFGSPDSNLLLLPYGPAVNFINHSREKANAVVQWSNRSFNLDSFLSQDPNVLLGVDSDRGIMIEFVALRDILPGEEILIDYGDDWIQAWEKHVREWKPQDEDYVTAADYGRLRDGGPIRTEAEQKSDPYPQNLGTACYFTIVDDISGMKEVEWPKDVYNCLRPCDVKERTGKGLDTYYTAVVYPMNDKAEPQDDCANVPAEGLRVIRLPLTAVGLVSKPYSADTFLKSAFRHEIRAPDGMYPPIWNKADPKPMGDFSASPLKPGQLEHVRWRDTDAVVTPNAYRVGLGSQVREKLLEYCDKMGITELFHDVVINGNGLELGSGVEVELDGGKQWYIRAPGERWRADMHWLSPDDEESTQDWLEMLSAAGFDEILKGIGETLGLEGLVAFHGTFMGVSLSNKHYLHYDVRETGRKMFNIIIPLILANETGPEFDLQDSNGTSGDGNVEMNFGRYRYEKDVAVMIGDFARYVHYITFYAMP